MTRNRKESPGFSRGEERQLPVGSVPIATSGEPPRSWQELTELGDIAYVGAFVDRSGKEAA